eukprot:Gb_06332 [translate_table: standard]
MPPCLPSSSGSLSHISLRWFGLSSIYLCMATLRRSVVFQTYVGLSLSIDEVQIRSTDVCQFSLFHRRSQCAASPRMSACWSNGWSVLSSLDDVYALFLRRHRSRSFYRRSRVTLPPTGVDLDAPTDEVDPAFY